MYNHESKNNEHQTETPAISSISIDADNEVAEYSKLPEIQKLFDCDQDQLENATNSAFEKILSKAKNEEEREILRASNSLSYNTAGHFANLNNTATISEWLGEQKEKIRLAKNELREIYSQENKRLRSRYNKLIKEIENK